MTGLAEQDEQKDRRMTRAKEIASHPETIEKIGVDQWSVPSQSGFGRYRVWFVEREGRSIFSEGRRRVSAYSTSPGSSGVGCTGVGDCRGTPWKSSRLDGDHRLHRNEGTARRKDGPILCTVETNPTRGGNQVLIPSSRDSDLGTARPGSG